MSSLFHPIPSDYEAWLENLSSRGWQPKNVSKWCPIVMVFKKCKPKKYRYVLDLQTDNKFDYVTIYEDFGWELCGKITNAFLWRMEYEGQRPESFTDVQTLKERNNRFFKAISFSYLLQIIIEIIITYFFAVNINFFDRPVLVKYLVLLILSYIYTIYLTVTMSKIRRKVG
jgi:hypothetical protein